MPGSSPSWQISGMTSSTCSRTVIIIRGFLSLKPLKRQETDGWGSDRWMIEKGFQACHVVDGQQRLTTFVILLNEIVCFVRTLDEQ